MKKVSIIVPIYDSEKYLNRCINSIINQTYRNLEIILINDGSKDNSLKIINEYKNNDERIIVINKKNSGVSNSRNVGIEVFTGDYITFVDSDDWLELDMIEKMMKIVDDENIDIVRCNYFRNYKDNSQKKSNEYENEVAEKILAEKDIKEIVLPQILSGKMPGYMWLLLINKKTIKDVVKLNENLAMMEDTVFYIDILTKVKKIYFTNQYLYHYYCNEDSASKSPENYIRNFKNVLLVNNIMKNKLKENGMNTIEMQQYYNTAHAKAIENICFKLSKVESKKNLYKIYSDIFKKKKINEIIDKASNNEIFFYNRIALKHIKNKQISKLIKYYKIRAKFSNLKTLVTRRKEI